MPELPFSPAARSEAEASGFWHGPWRRGVARVRAFFALAWLRFLQGSLVALALLAAWGAHDLDRRVRAARHDGSTWSDLQPWRDPDAAVATGLRVPLTVLVDRSVATLRLRGVLLPVRGVSAETLTPSFHDRRSGDRRHQAIDIPAPEGTPVLAAVDGVIVAKAEGGLGGKHLYQRDSTGSFVFYYAHLDGWPWGLGVGDRVVRGEVIGYVGSTGNAPSSAPHLHFAIYKTLPGSLGPRRPGAGVPVDPWQVLRP